MRGQCGVCGREAKLFDAPWRDDPEMVELFGTKACQSCCGYNGTAMPRCQDCGRWTRAVDLERDPRGYTVVEIEPAKPPWRETPVWRLLCGRCAARRGYTVQRNEGRR